ncbi:hypothetical protein EIP91_007192, partial [Steccherinum ochraceum]
MALFLINRLGLPQSRVSPHQPPADGKSAATDSSMDSTDTARAASSSGSKLGSREPAREVASPSPTPSPDRPYHPTRLPGPPSTTTPYYSQVRMSPSVHHPSRSDSYPLRVLHQYQPKPVTRPAIPPPDAAQRAMCHIHALPVELLSRIFLIGWQEDPLPDDILTSQTTFEALVSHVSHRWRDVALHIPVLWSIVHFRTHLHIHRAHTYLARNRHPHLIDVFVDTCAQDEHLPGFTLFRDEFFPVFAVVIPHIARWRSLNLKVRDLQCKAHARSVLSTCGGAPHLETLHLWHVENWGNAERLYTAIGPPPVVVFDQTLPALKHIILTGVNLPWTHSPFLKNLTSVEFALHSDDVRMPYDLWRKMLLESPHLARLALHYSGPRFGAGDWPDVGEKIVLPGLREVDLTNMEPAYLLALFRRLEMPGVKRVRLEFELPDQDWTPFLRYLVERDGEEEQRREDGEDGVADQVDSEEEEGHAGDDDGEALNGGPGSGEQGNTHHTNANANLNGNATPPADTFLPTNDPNNNAAPRRRRRRRRHGGPVFPALEHLAVCAIECTPEAWRRFLQASSPTLE